VKFIFKVLSHDEGSRLDIYLSSKLKNITRNIVQRLIGIGNVEINGVIVEKNSLLVNKGDEIKINTDYKEDVIKSKEILYKDIPINIVYKDDNLLVVNKQTGLVVHPAKGNYDNTLLNGLEYKYNKDKNSKEKLSFYLINRIDKDTSGIVLVALNRRALWFFSRQFEERDVEKYYIAVVNGDISNLFKNKKKYCCSNYIGRNPKNRKKFSVVDKDKGRLATTDFYCLDKKEDDKFGKTSIVLARLRTGRTHQIRVHLSQLGYPIVGDNLYGSEDYDRMMLHSYLVRINMFDRRSDRTFRAPIPKAYEEFFDLNNIIKKIDNIISKNDESI